MLVGWFSDTFDCDRRVPSCVLCCVRVYALATIVASCITLLSSTVTVKDSHAWWLACPLCQCSWRLLHLQLERLLMAMSLLRRRLRGGLEGSAEGYVVLRRIWGCWYPCTQAQAGVSMQDFQ